MRKLRAKLKLDLFKMQSGDILQASDDLSHAVNSYEKFVDGRMISGETESAQQKQAPVRRGTFCFQRCA